MKCGHIREMMGAYLYGDLSPVEMNEVRLHIRECSQCREDLAEQKHIISLISDSAPQLTDEERERIAWTIKGAVRFGNRTHLVAGLRSQFVRPLALSAVLAVSLAIGILVSMRIIRVPLISIPGASVITSKRSEPARDESKTHPKGIVKITEEETDSVGKEVSRTRDAAERPALRRKHVYPVDRFATVVRRGATFGTAARNGSKSTHEEKLTSEEPVIIANPDYAPEGNLKLPEPTDLNDAQTSSDSIGNR